MWWFVAQLLFSIAISYLLRPKPQVTPPATLDEFEVPVAQEGKPIAVVFGRRRVADPNVVWYGDLKTVAISSSGGKK